MTNQLEDPIQQRTRLAAAQAGLLMQRNNVGAFQDVTGRWVRYGLMNDSPKVNERIKSSDLIGITPVLVGPEHVGQILGIYTAIETKREGWKMLPSDKRATAQLRYQDIVRAHGGFAGFLSDLSQLMGIIGR